ncbi:MAG: ABC-F family ATP-binding cassette domain-containing protein [bacterium]|nr:ABC-F family ATP-binding cassette domain-containing protein [bacterium]
MPSVTFNSVSFHYKSPYREVFTNLSLDIDSSWKCGLTARNGKGKTTLLKLIHGELSPDKGFVSSPLKTFFFNPVSAEILSDENAADVALDFAGPYRAMERMMAELSMKEDMESLKKHEEVREEYERACGYRIRSSIIREAAKLSLPEDLLIRPFSSLSGGEKTKLLIAAMAAYDGGYLLLDEPTNHLDMESRELLAEYLSGKRGFVVISHDRYFLDLCTDHTIAMNRESIEIIKGGYSVWRGEHERVIKSEIAQNENLGREIKSLKRAADERRKWADSKEEEVSSAGDRGYVSHMSAKLMKRALNIERRMNENIRRKEELLKDFEKRREIKAENRDDVNVILKAANLSFGYEGGRVIDNLTFSVKRGDRVALIGRNGCGKTTLLKLILGELEPSSGSMRLSGRAKTAYAPQEPVRRSGKLEKILEEAGADRVKFSQITGSMGIERNIFEFDLADLSDGERKKVDIALTLMEPANLLIWDEPLNSLDVQSREMLERMILKHSPTLLFVEHDRYFIERCATAVLEM